VGGARAAVRNCGAIDLFVSGVRCFRNTLNFPPFDYPTTPRTQSAVLAPTRLEVHINQLVGRERGWGPLRLKSDCLGLTPD
jgi:hypothetical protein